MSKWIRKFPRKPPNTSSPEKSSIPKKMATPEDLRAMDLQLKKTNDECLVYGQWVRLENVHALAKLSYQSDVPKDDGDWWRHAAPTANSAVAGSAPRCNLPASLQAEPTTLIGTFPKKVS